MTQRMNQLFDVKNKILSDIKTNNIFIYYKKSKISKVKNKNTNKPRSERDERFKEKSMQLIKACKLRS